MENNNKTRSEKKKKTLLYKNVEIEILNLSFRFDDLFELRQKWQSYR